MTANYQVISGDSHLEGPIEQWVHRIPTIYRDRAPRTIKLADGGDAILVEGRPLEPCGTNLCAGKPYESWRPINVSYEHEIGAGSPEQRLRELDQDGIDAEIIYPGLASPRMISAVKHEAAYKAMLRAYNEFLAEDYCAVDPARLIGQGLIPETGVRDAITEMEYCLKKGLKGVVLTKYPSGEAYPSEGDDPFWAAAVEMQVPVSIHLRLDTPDNVSYQYKRLPHEAEMGFEFDFIRKCSAFAVRAGPNATALILTGVFDRFPRLRIYMAENNVGWVPSWAEQLDNRYKRHYKWACDIVGVSPLQRTPSEYVRDNLLWGFIYDPIGVKLRHEVGVDNILWGTDFPHSECDWPRSREVISELFAGVPEDERRKMLVENAVSFFHLA